MPDLVFRRDGTHPPVKNACVYCGRPAAHTRPRTYTNPRLDPRPGGGRYEVPRGGDDLGCLAVVVLPLLLVNVVCDIRDGRRHRAALKNAPPLAPPDTAVVVPTCDRHRRFGRRFVWAVLAWLPLNAVTFGLAALFGGPAWALALVIASVFAYPFILLMMLAEHGPARVTFVGRDTVTLAGVRQAYFDAPDRPAGSGL